MLLIELAKRGADRTLAPPWPKPAKKQLEVAIPEDQCAEDDFCGDAQVVPGTKLWRVIVYHGCGDCCYTTWNLYDPSVKRYLSLTDSSKDSATPLHDEAAVSNFAVSADGSAFIMGGAIYAVPTAERPARAAVVPLDAAGVDGPYGNGGGWLGGQWYLD